MKTLFPIFLLAFLLVGSYSASGQVGPPPPMAPDYEPEWWKEYSFAEDGIRFKFPAVPKAEQTTTGTQKRAVRVYRRESFMMFELQVVSFPTEMNLEGDKKLLNGYVEGGLERVKHLEPKILSQQDVSVDGHPARLVTVETKDGLIIRTKFFAVKNRLYLGYAISKKGDRHGINWENGFEKPAMGFLDSLRVIPAK